MPRERAIYGVLAEFDTPEAILEASKTAYDAGYRKMDAYAPFPVEGLSDAIGFHKTRLPFIVLAGGLIGGLAGYFMMYYSAAIDYPVNIGGRPLHSWPAFIPITFECTVLGAVLASVLGMLALNGLPEPYHPVFSSPRFELASRSHFFLCIEADDHQFDVSKTGTFLESIGAHDVTVIRK
jgi:hypothetical protein